MLQRNGLKAALIAGINGLRNAEVFRDIGLLKIAVLAHIAQPSEKHSFTFHSSVIPCFF